MAAAATKRRKQFHAWPLPLAECIDEELPCTAIRLEVWRLLALELCGDGDTGAAAAAAYSREVERQVYWLAAQQLLEYNPKITQLMCNLARNGARLMALYDPAALASLDDAGLRTGTALEEWWTAEAAHQRLEYQLLYGEGEEAGALKEESMLACQACKSQSISIEQKQTRGADEAMTVFCQCRGCGKRWKM